MLTILFTIVLSGINYNVVQDCNELGKTYFPLDDNKEIRVLSICTYYPEQTKQIVVHELVHICMHSHLHTYKTQEEMNKHLHQQEYSEEYFATIVSPCLIENEDKLFTALEKHHVNLSGDGKGN